MLAEGTIPATYCQKMPGYMTIVWALRLLILNGQ